MDPVLRNFALLRVVAAVAWADGVVSPEEAAYLHKLADDLGLGDRHAELEALVSEPVAIDTFEQYLDALREVIHSPVDHAELLFLVEKMAAADSTRSDDEVMYLRVIRDWIRSAEDPASPTSVASRDVAAAAKEAAGEAPAGESPAGESPAGEAPAGEAPAGEAPAGEAPITPAGAERETAGMGFSVRLRGLLGGAKRRAAGGALSLPAAGAISEALGRRSPGGQQIPPERRLYVTLFGALLYRVARADRLARGEEQARLRSLLGDELRFTSEEIGHVLDLLEAEEARAADRQRLCAEFNRISDMDERLTLLEALFALALVDGRLTEAEEKEVRLISNYLWIEPQEYVRIRRDALRRTASGA